MESDAQALANDLLQKGTIENAENYQLLVARHARLFWNHWIETDHGLEQPTEVKVGELYRYRISFSALDFEAFQRNEQQARDRLPQDEVGNYLPTQLRYRISVLPVGAFAEQGARAVKIRIDETILKATLTDPQIPKAGSYKTLAERYDALFVVAENLAESKTFSYEFQVTKPGCPGLAVIVWSDYPRKIITSWIRPIRAVGDNPPLPPDALRELSDHPPDLCSKPIEISRRVGPSAIPWFDTADDTRAVARLAFVDFEGYSIGGFQDLRRPDEEPLSWVVEQPLRQSLATFGDFVNARINRADFSLQEPSEELWKVLFKCADQADSDCDGVDALRSLRHLAEETPGSRVQASFRDIAGNGTYYLPIHLLEQTSTLRFVQPLPVPVPASGRQPGCVREWSGGLIVSDNPSLDEPWRKGFMTSFAESAHHLLLRSTHLLQPLKDDLSNPRLVSTGPEGFVVLAHHGDGDISDTAARDAQTRIKPGQVKRLYQPGSVTLLVACSVGTLGDLARSSSRFLFSLNEHNMQAAVISPFQVSPHLARSFLEAFRAVVETLTQDATLFDVLDATKRRIQHPDNGDESLGVQAAVETFMIVGDGDVIICKPGQTP
jgi:hypothetical protein